MTTEITIPAAALDEGANAIKAWLSYTLDKDTRASELTDGEHAELARAACLAMLTAWPGMKQEPETTDDHGAIHWPAVIILPLTEASDDQ